LHDSLRNLPVHSINDAIRTARVGRAQSAGIAADGVAFAFGLATTLALLGVVASLAGKAYGQVTDALGATHF
jgi:hypothetical protein